MVSMKKEHYQMNDPIPKLQQTINVKQNKNTNNSIINIKLEQTVNVNDKNNDMDIYANNGTITSNIITNNTQNKNIYTYKCFHCTEILESFSRFEFHNWFKHKDETPYKCTYCSKSFKQHSFFHTHIRYHTNVKSPKIFKCNYCNETFKHLKDININRIQKNNGKYSCKYCKKKFCIQLQLVKHTITHEKDKPFKCVLCDKAYKKQSYFKAHERIHTGEKPFKCDKCHKLFRQKSEFTKHKKTHIQLPFKIDIKRENVTPNNNIKKAKKKKYGKKQLNIPICEKHKMRNICKSLGILHGIKIDINLYGFDTHLAVYDEILNLIKIDDQNEQFSKVSNLSAKKLRDIKSKLKSEGKMGKTKELIDGICKKLSHLKIYYNHYRNNDTEQETYDKENNENTNEPNDCTIKSEQINQ